MTTSRTLKVVDLFAGVGGLSDGFAHDTAFEIVAANEVLPAMATAYTLNHPTVKLYCKDIKQFGIADLTSDFGIGAGDIDIIIGGPPCQAYSTVGKRCHADPRGTLFQEYYRVLSELKPLLFVFENVKGLLSMQNGGLIKTIVARFESLGYHVTYKLLNAADYGVPQTRERVFMVGTRLNTCFVYPEPTHGAIKHTHWLPFDDAIQPYITLGAAIGDLPFIQSGDASFSYCSSPQNEFQDLMRTAAPEKLADHNAPKNSQHLIDMMCALPDGGTPLDLPESLRPKSGFANTYCRLWWDRPSTTLTRNFSTPSSSRCIHPKAPRALTTREGARLQGFPDKYVFYGSRSDKNLQIGNAVSPVVSRVIKNAVRDHLA